MRVRVSMGPGMKPVTLEVAQCESCEDLVSVTTDPLDAHGHCAACQEPREVPCGDCAVLTREDVLTDGLCESCAADAYEREEQAAEE